MKIYLFTVDIPKEIWKSRIIASVEEKGEHLLYWTVKELNSYYSGEFSWKKLGLTGVAAFQYISLNKVRLLVKAGDIQTATAMVKSYSSYLDPKKGHKKIYVPRKSGTLAKVNDRQTETEGHLRT